MPLNHPKMVKDGLKAALSENCKVRLKLIAVVYLGDFLRFRNPLKK